MGPSSTAIVPTEHASRYLQQLCKHWAHNLRVDYTADRGTIVFPHDARGANWPGDATVTLTADTNALVCRIDATAPEQLDGLKGALVRHIERFAFRESPLPFTWQDSSSVEPLG